MMILNFTNINRFLMISFSFLIFSLGCSHNVYNDYTINIKNENYELVFFSFDGEILLIRTYPQEPQVLKVNENLFKVVFSTGLDCNYTFFVDTKSKKVSEDYFNLLFHNDREIVFLKEDTIYVADLFVENIRTLVKRDFSKTAVPQSAITCIKLQDNKLYIEYLSGEDYESVVEEIILE